MIDTKTHAEKVKNAFHSYAQLGWHVIPCVVFETTDKNGQKNRQKVPLVSWKNYQEKAPTFDEINSWLSNPQINTLLGIGVVTGRGVVGIDFDQKDGKPSTLPWAEELMDTMYTVTASGNMHAYFSCPPGSTPQNATNIFKADKARGDTLVDVRGSGGFIVVGPTILWDKDPRQFKDAKPISSYRSFNVAEPNMLKELPSTFRKQIHLTETLPRKWTELSQGTVKQGTRHDTAKSIIGKLIHNIRSKEEIDIARRTFYAIMTEHFADPLPADEVDAMFDWAIARERERHTIDWEMSSKILTNHLKEQKDQHNFEEDMSLWKDLQFIHAEATDTLIVYHTKDGKRVHMSPETALSQHKFRNAVYLATQIIPPKIRQRSFEMMLARIPTTRVEGVDVRETVRMILDRWFTESDSIENPLELEDRLRRSPSVVANVEGKARIYFIMSYLIRAVQREIPHTNRGFIFDTARFAGCKEVSLGQYKYWYYERP